MRRSTAAGCVLLALAVAEVACNDLLGDLRDVPDDAGVDADTGEASSADSGASDGTTPSDGAGPDADASDSGGGATDSGGDATDSGGDAADSGPAPEGGTSLAGVTLVQSIGSTEVTSVSFHTPTTKGTLLVAMQAGSAVPPAPVGLGPDAGSSWIVRTLTDGDGLLLWPNNPGGLTTFTVGDSSSNYDIILAELGQVPASVAPRWEVDTGNKPANPITTLSCTGDAPDDGTTELVLLYFDCSSSNSITVSSGWTYIATDGNQNFAYWQLSTTTPSASAQFPAPDYVSMMLVGLE